MPYILVHTRIRYANDVVTFSANSDKEAEKTGMGLVPTGASMMYIARVVTN
jgi:hypothetical protein